MDLGDIRVGFARFSLNSFDEIYKGQPDVFLMRDKSYEQISSPTASGIENIVARTDVLQNHDLLYLIFQHLTSPIQSPQWARGRPEIPFPDYSCRSLLFHLALTCRAFFDPALDALWNVMNDLHPLFKVLPAFTKIGDKYDLQGNIEDADWERFNMYARRIRVLVLQPDRVWVAGDLYERIAQIHPETLVPNLRRLFVAIQGDRWIKKLPSLCVSPSLGLVHMLDTLDSECEPFIPSFITAVAKEAPTLAEIALFDEVSSETLALLAAFHQLRTLRLLINMPKLRAALPLLSTLPRLSQLNLQINSDSTANPGIITHPKVLFPSPHTLKISGLAKEVHEILDITRQQDLNRLEVTFDEPPSDAEFRLTASRLPSITSLQHLKLSLQRDSDSQATRAQVVYPVTKDSIFDLRPLRLKSLVIENFPGRVKDVDFQNAFIAGTWDNLQVLHLPRFIADGAPSLTSLAYLARNCPQLVTLKICVDPLLQGLPFLKHELNRLPLLHRLARLELGRVGFSETSSLQEILIISRHIDHLFPYLPLVHSYDEKDMGNE